MAFSFLTRAGIAAATLALDIKKAFFELLSTAVVAAAGSSQATATELTAKTNIVTAADGTKGVRLPVGNADMSFKVVNSVADQILKVYPEVGGVINAIAANGAFSVGAGSEAEFVCTSKLQWYVRQANGTTATISQAELAYLDGALSTNLVAEKAAILGTAGALTLGGALTAVTSIGIGSAVLTEAEMEMLDTLTPGTPTASKALVLGSTKDIGSFRMTGKLFTPQAAPETSADTVTLTDAQMLSGILVATPTAAAAYTVRTGTQLEAALLSAGFQVQNGDCFDLTIINLGGAGDDITLTADTGITIVGSAVVTVAAPSQGTFRFRRTAANTFVAYRVS